MSRTVFAGNLLLVVLAFEAPAVLDKARNNSKLRFIAVDANGCIYGYSSRPVYDGRMCTWRRGSENVGESEISLGWPTFLKRLEPSCYHEDWRGMIAELPR